MAELCLVAPRPHHETKASVRLPRMKEKAPLTQQKAYDCNGLTLLQDIQNGKWRGVVCEWRQMSEG